MDKKQIHDLLTRYVNGECEENERNKVHSWYSQLQKAEESELSGEERELLENKLWENISVSLEETSATPLWKKSLGRKWSYISGIAAALVLGFGLVWFNTTSKGFISDQLQSFTGDVKGKSTTNEGSDNMMVKLEDGSKITLSPGSKLYYPDKFEADKREVSLEGNAFFDIAPNPLKPFIVHNGRLITKVLGTSFWIRTDVKSRALEVEVVSGKVSVFEKNSAQEEEADRRGVVLTPNQRVTYYPEKGYLLPSLVEAPAIIDIREPIKLTFDNTDMPAISALLQQKFGIEIVLAHEGLEQCAFTGDINGLPLYDALDLLCKSIGAEYEIKSTRILISGNGCN